MRTGLKIVLGVLLAAEIAFPFSAYALGIPLGGRVTAVVPCVTGGYMVTVVGFGIGSGLFFYAPGALTYLYGPPTPGRWVLGLADAPSQCGVRIQMVGTSLSI